MECKCNKISGCCKNNWIRSLIWAIAIVVIVFLNSCEKEEIYTECIITSQRELVRIEGVEVEVYYQITLCDDGFEVWEP